LIIVPLGGITAVPRRRKVEETEEERKVTEYYKMFILVTGKNAKATAFFHSGEILLSLPHVGVDLIHALLDPVQLFCFVFQVQEYISWPAIQRPSINMTQRGEGNHARKIVTPNWQPWQAL